jgi:hypothetical protein
MRTEIKKLERSFIMKIYNHSGVKYWTDTFNNLKSFDIINTDELEELNTKLIEYFKSHPKKDFLHFIPGMQHTVFERLKGDYFYLELPYEFFNDHLVAWSGDVCISDSKVVELYYNSKKVYDKQVCECYECFFKNKDAIVSHVTWSFVKEKILKGENWKQIWINPTTGKINEGLGVPSKPNHPEMYETFRDYGIAKPIYNYSDINWPSVGIHRIAYCSILKTDVPIFFKLLHPDHGEWGNPNSNYESLKNQGLVREDQYIYLGLHPYFRNTKYCVLLLTPKLKKVEFYLSYYKYSFDENRDEKVGELIYK